MRSFLVVTALVTVVSLSSCSILRTYRGDTSQGVLLTQDDLSQLKVGMTKEQVTNTLGSPILTQPMESSSTMIYVYRFQPGYGTATQQEVVIHFDAGGHYQNYVFHPMKAMD